jgi:DNA-binding MarR family transcriptional regulator
MRNDFLSAGIDFMSARLKGVDRPDFSGIVRAVVMATDKSRCYMEASADFYAHLCSVVPGSTSLNELRLLTSIGLATLKDQHIGVTELSTQLNIPLSTASRLVAKLCEDGRVICVRHPRDDRRRSLRFSPVHLDGLAEWARSWFAIREQIATPPAR